MHLHPYFSLSSYTSEWSIELQKCIVLKVIDLLQSFLWLSDVPCILYEKFPRMHGPFQKKK